MIIVIYGINGVGKDAIAGKISKLSPSFVVVPQSKLLMYHLGLASGFTPEAKLKINAYPELETIKEERIAGLASTLCRDTVLKLSDSGKIVLYLGHLVIARFSQQKYYYFVSVVSEWIKKESNGLVFIKSNPENILDWRKKSERKRSKCLAEINFQQEIAEEQWKKLIDSANIPHVVIQNHPKQIYKAVDILIKFIEKI